MRNLSRSILSAAVVTAFAIAALSAAGDSARAAATFNVTKAADSGGGACDSDCSLREAIVAANQTLGADAVVLPAGSYLLSIAGAGENAAATGDLDIAEDLVIEDIGESATFIDAAGIDRVFHVLPGITATISGVTIRGGSASSGRGIFVYGSSASLDLFGAVALSNVVLSGNSSALHGGGISSSGGGTLAVLNSFVGNNTAVENGGGILSVVAAVDLNSSTNSAQRGAGLSNQGGTVSLLNSSVSGNDAGLGGGWIESPAGAYAVDATLAGRVNFGFVSKYKKGTNVPSGQTNFQFTAADFKFRSTEYQ